MYRQVLNGFAMNAINTKPNIPDFHLMVGSAEELAPLPLILQPVTAVPSAIVQNMNNLSQLNNEEIAAAIENNTLEINDFNINIASLGV